MKKLRDTAEEDSISEEETPEPWAHTDDCPATDRGERCHPKGTIVDKPPWLYLDLAERWFRDEYGLQKAHEVPWCRIRQRARKMIEEDEA